MGVAETRIDRASHIVPPKPPTLAIKRVNEINALAYAPQIALFYQAGDEVPYRRAELSLEFRW
jgi:hypothetical protein